MDKEVEYKTIINCIPTFSAYGSNAQLQISLPTTSHITLGEAFDIIHKHANNLGWPVKNIAIIKTGGYIICEECKNQMHIHIATPENKYCMNCGHDEGRTGTPASVRVVE
ncbi:MAG: hypothetical protein ACXAC2_09610 [Candidatus Kariarchaeaceae archaeon]